MEAVVAIIAIVVIVALVIAAAYTTRLRWRSTDDAEIGSDVRVAEFHVRNEAQVFFDVDLPAEGADDALTDLLLRQAVEVVREKRKHLPMPGIDRVIAFARSDEDWARVGAMSLETPGELPPETRPMLLPHHEMPDPLERISDLPSHAPGLETRAAEEALPPIRDEVAIPSSVAARLRAQGRDPVSAGAGDIVLGILRCSGYGLSQDAPDRWTATKSGRRVMVKVVPHAEGEYPELDEAEVREAVVDFVESRADRGLLVTEKYSPYEIYERERRDPRLRFITRERIQHFVDSLALG